MAAPNGDAAMRGMVGIGGPSSLVPGPNSSTTIRQQVVHHQQLQPPPAPHHPPMPNHIQQLQNLTTAGGAHNSTVVLHNAIHQQQQHRIQQHPPPPRQQLFHHQQQQQHKISQFSGNINNLVFAASVENASASGEMNMARSGLSGGREGSNVVVNIASVNPSGENSGSSASSNSTSINPVVNRIASTSVGHIPVENVQVLQQYQQLNETSSKTSSATMSPRAATNVAPGWRRIKYNCEIIYISPSGAPLRNFNQVKEYLLSGGTCKCGLPCPFRPEAFFEFDSQVPNASLDSNLPHNFCLHHTGYMEKVEIVRRGKKVIESDGSSTKDILSLSEGANFTHQATHDIRLPVPANTKLIANDGTNSSNIPSSVLNHGPSAVTQQVLLQSDKEISSIPLSKTPPWRKNNPPSASKPNPSAAPVVMAPRQMHSSSVLVPGKTSVQSVNQNEQIVKNSRIINEPLAPRDWPAEEGLSMPPQEVNKVKSTTKKRPNFKDDPTGYLNQQTAILHSSISTLHSPDGSSSSQEGATHLKTVVGYDSGEPETPQTDRGSVDDSTSTTTMTLGGQTVTHIANGMVQVQQNCDISHMKLQQQMQFQQQLQRQSQLVRQHHEQLQLLQQQQSSESASKNVNVRFVTTAQESPVPCNNVTFTTSRTPDVTSTSPSTPDLKGPVQGGAVSTSNRSPMLQGNVIMARAESPETFSSRNFVQSPVGIGMPKNQSISNNSNAAYGGNAPVPRHIIAAKPLSGLSSVENKMIKSTSIRENDTGAETSTGAVLKTEKVLIHNSGSSTVVGFNQQGQMITQQQPQQQQQHQQVLMTSNGQIILMSAQPNKNPNTIVMSGNSNNPGGGGGGASISPNVIIPQQSMMGVNTSQYISTGSSGNTVSTVTTNAGSNSSGIMHNITQHHPQQSNIIHHSQSNANSSFLINPQNNMQPTVILNNGNVIQSGGQQILTAANGSQMIHSGNVLTTAAASGPKMISGNGNAGIITNQSNINQLLSLPPNSIVIQQPNYNSVQEGGGHIVNQVINQDGTTTSYIQHQQQNPQRQILISTDAKRKAKKRKSTGSTNPMLSPQQQPQPQQTSTVTQQTLQQIGQSGTMLQLTPPFPTQSFQLSQGISGLTIVPNKNSQPPQQQQQQILLQNGQIITQPYNIISQQVLLPAGLMMAPDATTLVQIQNVGAPCGTIINTPQGMMIRAQSPHQQKSFLSPGSGQQFIMNSSGQISPMGAQMYGGPVNIVVPQQQAGTASFVQQGTAIIQQSQPSHMVHHQAGGSSASLNTSTDSSSTASESPSLPTTPQPAPIVQQKSLASSYLSGTASPPDTTTHSPNSPECASSEKSGGSADSMSMAMVQCVSSSEPDFVPPSIAEGAQSPSEATEMFEQGGLSYQRIAYKSSEPKIRRIQTPTHQPQSFTVRSTGSMHESSQHSGNTIISTSLPSPQINQHQHQQQQFQNHILRHQHNHQQQQQIITMSQAGSPSTSGGVQPDSHGGQQQPQHPLPQQQTHGIFQLMRGRKLNSQLERAIQEAMMELDRSSETSSPLPAQAAVNSTNSAVIKTKTITIKASPTSSTSTMSIPHPISSSQQLVTAPPNNNNNSNNKTVKPRGPKSKLVKIAPAPPVNAAEPMLGSGSSNSSNVTLESNRVKLK
ncbi:methyl-CpG-binding domain protein 5 isoform X3 [Culex pipiens pallens]|uniref:methyl-CpG-binding domain protein 5 isoform X3 n=1 Tax=Culex pipiens pallens TaxID=42434 RepID=UPI0022AA8DB0|nr:methyl-CpG-binding domain protein 5 isoform X3 [Culex pipiens pallens]